MLVGLVILVFFFTFVKPDGPGKKDWGYTERDGPHIWKGTCAEGFRQSPINFKASELNIVFLPKLYFPYYNKAGTVDITNKGESISVSGFDTWGERQPYIFGGGLQKYRLIQFHFHWAQKDLDGSEHTVGDLYYPAEIHFVHYKGNYTQNEAVKHPDGIAVVGVFLTLASEGRSLAKINRHLQSLNKTVNTVQVNGFVPDTLLPLNTDAFYRYEGSLTTPGCHESVIWTVMADPIPISQEQLDIFRQMRSDLPIKSNSRPVKPVNRRKVSFRPTTTDQSVQSAWGYGQTNGPYTWTETCAEGFRQSPIDFKASELDIAFFPKIHFVHYRRAGSVKVRNTGFSVSVSGFHAWGEYQPYIFGGGLEKYKLDHFHFHWAQNSLNGSEHTVGSLHYPVEAHFVHVKDGYTLAKAVNHPDGVAVVGVFFTLASEGRSLAKLTHHLQYFNQTTDTVTVDGFVCDTLLPMNADAFYRYNGSLTTPGCHESVIWTVMADPIPITQEQLDMFRKIRNNRHIEYNTRPVQPLNKRKVSFRPRNFHRSHVCGSTATSNARIGFIIIPLIITFNFMS